MKIIPEKHSKRWIGRLLITILFLTLIFSLAFGVKIRNEIQAELIWKYATMAAIFAIINCFFGVVGLKRIYLFMTFGIIAGTIYLLYMVFISKNGAFQVVGFMTFVEFIGYSGILGAITEIISRVLKKKN